MARGFEQGLLAGGRFVDFEFMAEGVERGVEQAQDIALVVHKQDARSCHNAPIIANNPLRVPYKTKRRMDFLTWTRRKRFKHKGHKGHEGRP